MPSLCENGDYEAFAGIALKDFFATTRVKRMDQGESTGGIYYYTEGASSPVKILLLRADDGTVKIRLTRGTGWDDRSDPGLHDSYPLAGGTDPVGSQLGRYAVCRSRGAMDSYRSEYFLYTGGSQYGFR